MIEVGEYVRTTDGRIYKVVDIDNIFIYVDKEVKYNEETNTSIDYIKKSSVVKHSKNIIDLIEVGAIIEINKGKYEVIYDKSLEQLGVLIPNRNHLAIRHSTLEHIFKEYKDIRILTKEQYMQNCYKIPEQSSTIN